MIYDCFIFNNELDLLSLRLNELNQVVDKFVLVESTYTFTGKAKPLFYKNNIEKYKKFRDKIIHIVISNSNEEVNPDELKFFKPKPFQKENMRIWSREISQRNAIRLGLKHCNKEDIILISDVDEIPRAKALKTIKCDSGITGFEQDNFYYFSNCKGLDKWYGTKAVNYLRFKETNAEEIRDNTSFKIIKNGGWHFSYMGGYGNVIKKLESYSHQELNTEDNIKSLKFNIENGLDIFNRPYQYKFIKLDKSMPKYLLSNRKIYNKYLYTDKVSAQNTILLRNEIYKVRTELYWKKLELQETINSLLYYQKKYRDYVKKCPIPYIINKIFITLRSINYGRK